MSENLRKYTRAMFLLDAVAARVPADAWDNPSCCEGWSARQVAGHAAWFLKNTGSLAAGEGPIEAQAEADVLGDDPAAELRSIVQTSLAQFDRPGSLARVTDTPFGEMPIDSFMGIVWVDPMTHAWDLADATGIAHGIDAPTATAALEQLQPLSEALRGPGLFGAPVESAASDPVADYIAFVGRTSVNA